MTVPAQRARKVHAPQTSTPTKALMAQGAGADVAGHGLLADFNRAIELRPDAGWIAAERGETYRLMDQPEQALADFNQAIEPWPDAAWIVAEQEESTTSEPLGER